MAREVYRKGRIVGPNWKKTFTIIVLMLQRMAALYVLNGDKIVFLAEFLP